MIETYNNDCFDVFKHLTDIDAIITDMPYGCTKCKWDRILNLDTLWLALPSLRRSKKTPFVLFGKEPFSSFLRISYIRWYRYDWIWKKNRSGNFLSGNTQPLLNYEKISVFYENQPTYNPQKTMNPAGTVKIAKNNPAKFSKYFIANTGKDLSYTVVSGNFSGKNYEPDKLLPKCIIEFPIEDRSRLHPTQKLVALLEYLIKTYTNEGETVLDFCAGSGTTAVAAHNTNRHCIVIEKDPEIYQKMLARFNALAIPYKERTIV